MIIIDIDYEGVNPPEYRAVTCTVEGRKFCFSSGDPTRDYAAAAIFAVRRNSDQTLNSSSVDSFVFDGGSLDDSEETMSRLLKGDPELKRMVVEQEAGL